MILMDLECHMVAISREQSKKPLLMFVFRMGSIFDLGEEQHLRYLLLLTFIQHFFSKIWIMSQVPLRIEHTQHLNSFYQPERPLD